MRDLIHCYAVDGDKHVLFRGHVGWWFKRSRWSAYRTNLHNGWWLRQEHLPDVLAELETDGLLVRVHRRPAPPHRPSAADVEEGVRVA